MKPRTVRADRVFLAAGLARFGLGASEQIEVWWDGEALYFRPLHGGDTVGGARGERCSTAYPRVRGRPRCHPERALRESREPERR